MPDDAVALLQAACAGLPFPSERDAPLVPFAWDLGAPELDAPALLRLIGRPPETPVERVDPDVFFREAASDRDWHGDVEKGQARRFRSLLETLKSLLAGLRVYRVGTIEIDAYVVGRAPSGRWAGLRTTLIET